MISIGHFLVQYLLPLFQNEYPFKTFLMKMGLHENDLIDETHFGNNCVTGKLVFDTQTNGHCRNCLFNHGLALIAVLNNWALIFTCKTLVNYLLFTIHLILNYSDFALSFLEVFSVNMRGKDNIDNTAFPSYLTELTRYLFCIF